MPNVCDPTQFPKMRYFQQYELAEFGPPDYSYEYTRGLKVETECDPFRAKLVDILLTQGQEFPGVPYDPDDPDTAWEKVVEDLFAPPLQSRPFDFALYFKSRIAIRLQDDFWWFSTSLAPITMKHQYGSQYFDLRLHYVDEEGNFHSHTLDEWNNLHPTVRCPCISFFTGEPCLDPATHPGEPAVFHGFSLNLELEYSGYAPLPITIDPDIENKGGNG